MISLKSQKIGELISACERFIDIDNNNKYIFE